MKKNLFKVLSLCLSAVVAVTICSCDPNNNPENPDNPGDDKTVVDLTISTSSVEVAEGEDVTVNILTGNGDYVVKSADDAIATATVAGKVITIHGVKAGATTISLKDGKGKAKPISVQVSSSGVNNINTDVSYTITLNSGETGSTNWWKPTLTPQVTGTLLLTKRDFLNGKLTATSFDKSTCGDFFALVDNDNIFVCGGYIGEGTKPDYGYAAPALLLTDEDDPAHPGCKKMQVITTNLAAYLSWSAYSSTPGSAWFDPTTGAFTLENCKGFLDWQGSENEKWSFNLCRTYTPEK